MKASCLALTCLLWLGCGEASEDDAVETGGSETSLEAEGGEAGESTDEGDEAAGEEAGEAAGEEGGEAAGEEGDEAAGEEGDEAAGEEGGEAAEEEGGEAAEGGQEEGPATVDGIPAPGSLCPIPEPWGYAKGDNLKNMAFKNCSGEDVTMYDAACGAAVSWVYFTYGW